MPNIAVIGSGIAGMSCAWWLAECGHTVTLYAGGERVGGHSHTVLATTTQGPLVPVDTGFIAFNERTYPNLMQLFARLDVPMLLTDMSFSVSLENGKVEYAGYNFASLFAQPSLLLDRQHWQMLQGILRFQREAPLLLNGNDNPTLGEYLATGNYPDAFINRHLMPLAASIWSTPEEQMLDFPARTFIRFCMNHGLMQLKDRPRWLTVKGGSIEYIKKITARYTERIIPQAVTRVKRSASGPIVEAGGNYTQYDQVVLACHADEALALLADPTPDESAVLNCFRFTENRTVLHQDDSLMPKRGGAWASWNALSPRQGEFALTCWMNQLQDISDDTPLFLTLNPPREPRPELVIAEFRYSTPLFDSNAIAAQPYIGALQGVGGLWYCGAWTGYGFHEDGITSGLTVAEYITGQARPWQVDEVSIASYNVSPRQLAAEEAA